MAAGLVLAAIVLALQTVVTSFTTHSALQQGDEWTSLALFRSVLAGGAVVSDMLSQHNEHRIVLPRLVLFTDYLVAGGRGWLDLAVIFATQALTCALFLYLLGQVEGRRPERAAVGAVVVLLMVSLRQSENFTWGFQVQFVGVFAAGCLAPALLAGAIARGRAGRPAPGLTLGALAAAGVATFSMSNGLLAGPTLTAVAVLGRAPRSVVLATVAATAALTAAFFMGYEVYGDGAPHHAMVEAPLRAAAYVAAYLGGLLDPNLGATVALGACGLAWVCVAAVETARGRDRDPVRLALLGIMLFTAGSAALTSVGRSAEGLGSAMASRYATGAACFWSAALIHAWSYAGAGRLLRLVPALAALVLVLGVLRAQAPAIAAQRRLAFARTVAGQGLVLGLVDDAALSAVDDDPDQVRALLPFLRERRLSVFADADADRLGGPLAAVDPRIDAPCPGVFDTARADPTLGPAGVRVGGTSTTPGRLPALRPLYLVDSGGRVAGLGLTDADGAGWRGYATAAPDATLDAYLRPVSGRLCRLGGARVTPPDRG